ncbi:isoprenyl transferase [Caldisericum exile]|uniref:Isoprenyl transferase n=1 Tax=Caldisericum exile (strain DSM 21853 / NBRC 104410 / AZM16c01) TaxID=511051 RepID=A0A7U6GEK7_CALEA|nr:isoprenyl transferase [Caldisericum exile]BAL80935.1 undecaprenyl pyrophosphate synthetase [Caldisericum exile AZM16c01]
MDEISPVPKHVVIIMDGNGRWAIERGLKRTEGHKEGVKVVKKIVEASVEVGIKYLTLFAFSTENWKRSPEEVSFLLNLFVDAIQNYIPELKENSVKLNFIGDFSPLPMPLRKAMDYALKETEKGTKLLLTVAINYGGRHEIIEACKQICSSGEDINEINFSKYLYTWNLPDPDLLIRTSGEMRLSNFLLFQIAYTELYFTKTLWPDFTKEEFFNILKDYNKRERRFGGV